MIMRVLFMGTPSFAVPSLKALLNSKHEVAAVVTQPDRALKRGKTEFSPVKRVALSEGIPVLQPEKISNSLDEITPFGADIAVTAAYGQILSQDFIDCFKYGVINVHASLLPKYRGASPIYSAILNGESETGVTIMQTESGLDTGDILNVCETLIADNDTASSLEARLSELGAKLLCDTLDNYQNIERIKQDGERATVCRTVKKEKTYIDFSRDAKSVVNQIRALADVPCARTIICGETYKIYFAREAQGSGKAGEIIECGDRLIIACGKGAIEVTEIQAAGKNRLKTADFLRGRKLPVGAICESQR